jgi:hypothetical protein
LTGGTFDTRNERLGYIGGKESGGPGLFQQSEQVDSKAIRFDAFKE